MWYLANPLALVLCALPLGIGVFFILKKRSHRSKTLLLLSGPNHLLREESRKTRRALRLLFSLFLFALLALAFMIARPVEVKSWIERWSEGIDIVVALDISESMIADDFRPNRITVAKAVIRDFIRRRTEDRIGIVLFGGESVTKTPLTRDYDFLLAQLEDVKTGELRQGTAIGMGITNAIGRLRYSNAKNRIIILLTDGDSNVGAINPITAAHLARQERIRIYTVGIGLKNRVLVPIYSKDLEGRNQQIIAQVPSYLNPELLKEISRLTSANAYLARDPGMLSKILHEIDSLEKTRVKNIPKEKRNELFVIPSLLILITLFLIFLLQETRYRKAYQRGPGLEIKRSKQPYSHSVFFRKPIKENHATAA